MKPAAITFAMTMAAIGCTRLPAPAPTSAPALVTAPMAPPSPAAAAAEVPDPFPGRRTVRVDELLAALAARVETTAAEPSMRADYAHFLATHALADERALYLDYVRVRLAFEATRAGGWWGLRWQVTDREPQSDAVWAQWRASSLADGKALPDTTAVAECDELSALFAVVAYGLGLSSRSEIGLFWPTANHTVAVWTIARRGKTPIRVVVPTSQIFLGPWESLGTKGFDPWTQANVYAYRRRDVSIDSTLPAPLARQFVRAAQAWGALPQREAQERRNARERLQSGG
jgi:hypothetical protein